METETPETQPAEKPPEGEAKTFDADYVKKLRDEAAKYRTEAKANAKAAERLAEIEEANKTEAQKTADRLAAMESETQAAKAEALRFKIAAKFGIPEDRAELYLTGADEELLTKQAEGLMEIEAGRKKSGNHVPREGATPTAVESDDRAFVRGLFGSGD